MIEAKSVSRLPAFGSLVCGDGKDTVAVVSMGGGFYTLNLFLRASTFAGPLRDITDGWPSNPSDDGSRVSLGKIFTDPAMVADTANRICDGIFDPPFRFFETMAQVDFKETHLG